MRYVKPDYFEHFQCTADKCPDTCCAGWQIMIDEESLDKYEQDTSPFGSRLMNGIDWQEGSFVQCQGRCAMLNEENLCDLITEKGEEWLCETCRRYPRHVEEFEGLREWSLSLSCPVAAEIMLRRMEPVVFHIVEDDEPDPLEEEFEDFDFLLFTQLEDARKVLLDIVQCRQIPIEYRKEAVLEMARQMQMCVEEGRLYDMDALTHQFAEYGKAGRECTGLTQGDKRAWSYVGEGITLIPQAAEARYEQLCRQFTYLEQLERLREEWTVVLQETKQTLYSEGYEAYEKIWSAFLEEFGEGASGQAQWEIFQEQLLVFFLYTYFCGAVYDDWIYSKAALSVFSTNFIQEFVMCRWFLADKHIDMADSIKLAYQYAREVEHSDDNLNLLEECLNREIS